MDYIDSGATCHLCNERSAFVSYETLKAPLKVKLGDGYEIDGIGSGTVALTTQLSNGKYKKCTLHNVLHIPTLSYNLLSVSTATERGKTVEFEGTRCRILNGKNLLVLALSLENCFI